MQPSSLPDAPQVQGSLSGPIQELISTIQLAQNEYPAATKMLIRGETKWIDWDFTDAPFKTLELIQITDVQWGNLACKRERVNEYIKWIRSRPNRYIIFTGDNIDAATMQSKGTTWDNAGTPQTQMFEFCKTWAPVRNRILGYVGGNHERRCLTTFGDLGITIGALLGLPYSSGKQHIDIRFGKHLPFRISQWHGMGGAQTIGTVAQKLYRFAADGDSQLYLMGHHHKPMIIPFWKERRGEHGMKAIKTIAATGSSFLDLYGSYGEVFGYAPSDVLMPRCVLDKDGGWEVTLR